jgi:hypothetical protein
MLPAVAVRQFVPRHAGIIDADDEAPVGRAVSTTTNSLSWERFGAGRPTASRSARSGSRQRDGGRSRAKVDNSSCTWSAYVGYAAIASKRLRYVWNVPYLEPYPRTDLPRPSVLALTKGFPWTRVDASLGHDD